MFIWIIFNNIYCCSCVLYKLQSILTQIDSCNQQIHISINYCPWNGYFKCSTKQLWLQLKLLENSLTKDYKKSKIYSNYYSLNTHWTNFTCTYLYIINIEVFCKIRDKKIFQNKTKFRNQKNNIKEIWKCKILGIVVFLLVSLLFFYFSPASKTNLSLIFSRCIALREIAIDNNSRIITMSCCNRCSL